MVPRTAGSDAALRRVHPAATMGTSQSINARPNRLLAALELRDQERFATHLKPIDLTLGTVLNGPCKRPCVYFPAGSIVSVVYETVNGGTCEIAIVGNEGMLGLFAALAGGAQHTRAVVQGAGRAYRMSGELIRREFQTNRAVRHLLLRYMQALQVQIAQSAVCNRHHTIGQQLARWLLMSLDRVPSHRLVMTQELIAGMLGVRREGVTAAAGRLQRAGAISYQRGRIEVLDRVKLESLSCECYRVVRSEFERLLPMKRVSALGVAFGMNSDPCPILGR